MNGYGFYTVWRWATGVVLAGCQAVALVGAEPIWQFTLGSAPGAENATRVVAGDRFTAERGFGYETMVDESGGDTPGRPSYFSAVVPMEGNYRVTVTLGDAQRAGSTTIKAELRRLMVARVDTRPGQFITRSFLVNVRSPRIEAVNGVESGWVDLKHPRETVEEAWAWDDAITLEFSGAAPMVQAVVIEPAPAAPTVFLIGDSTVCDQPREPFASWGQMLPRFFDATIAVANHAESGETFRASLERRRLDKLISVMQAGDYLFMQFGHNDQKQIGAGSGDPETYASEMRQHIRAARAVGALPVVVSSVERRRWQEDGSLHPTLTDYVATAAAVARAEGVPYLDLNAVTHQLYLALGPEKSATAFAAPGGKQDNTHHNNYGAWLIAAGLAAEIRQHVPELARSLRDDLSAFDPSRPPAETAIQVPPSPAVVLRPARPAAQTGYLFTYFVGNGADGLHLLWSEDGYRWQPVAEGRSVLTPRVGTSEVLMRDPCVTLGPDGVYHMVWTTGWHQNQIGHASTRDFITWTPQQAIPVMAHEPLVRNSWAPEVVYDEAAGEYVIFWASTVPGHFPETTGASEDDLNHRMYATTTRDWQTFTPTCLFYDPGFSVIDATQHRAGDGQLYWIIKDETRHPPRKHLRVARAASRQGPFGELRSPFSPEGVWVEGPTAVVLDGTTVVYYDAYVQKHYGALRSADLIHWEDISDEISLPFEGTPERVRHGTIIAVPRPLMDQLKEHNWSELPGP